MQLDFNYVLDIAQALLIIPFLYLLTVYIFKKLKQKYSFFNLRLMKGLFFYHLFFGVIYYIYAQFNLSDSHKYFTWPQNKNKEWLDFFGSETIFINFLSYPFINGLGFSYEMMMLLFTWIGFMGFVFAYMFFKENIPLNVKVFKKVDLLTLILFLPNMHFWTASLGKGAVIFLGLMLFAFAITKFKTRAIGLIIGSLIVFYVRPHIFLLLAIGAIFGIITGLENFSNKKKLIVFGFMILGLSLVQDQILEVVKLNNSQNLVQDFLDFTASRAGSLSNARSGVNMGDYSLPEKIFTFWFRPLFFDAPGILGIIVSIENFIYLLLFIKLFKINFIKFIRKAPVSVKMSLMLFLLTSFAMTFVMSNLGIIIRQKSMVMYFLFFVIYYFLAHEKINISNLKNNKFGTNLSGAL